MDDNRCIEELRLDIQRLKYSFPMRSIVYPSDIKKFSDIDMIFEVVWKQLKPYFIPQHFFGYNSQAWENYYSKIEYGRIAHSRDLFEIDEVYEGYIKSIFKRFCTISALEKSKEIAFDNQYVSVFHLAMLCKDMGYFATEKYIMPPGGLLANDIKAKSYIDDLMKAKLMDENKKQKKVLKTRYEERKERSFEIAIRHEVSKQISNGKEDKNRILRNEGKKIYEKAKRFRNNENIVYSNKIICWGNDLSQYVPFKQCDLSYVLIDNRISSFEAAINRIVQNEEDSDSSFSIKIANCMRAHFSIAELFKDFNDKVNIIMVDGSEKEIEYDYVDTLLINNKLEEYYHIDLLYEILSLRKKIRETVEFPIDSSLYDDTLLRLAKMPLPFTRVLFAEYAINARNYDMFLEKVDESQLANIYSKKYKRILSRKKQQLNWSDLFDRYVDQISRIFIPLLEKTFICSLYAGKERDSQRNIMKYNSELLNILYKYASENIASLSFDVLDDASFEKYNMLPDWSYPDKKPNNDSINNIRNKVKRFDYSNLEKSDIEFIDKFYKTIFTGDTGDNGKDDGIFEIFDKLALLDKGKSDIMSRDSSQDELLSDDYKAERAALDIKYMIDMIHCDRQ